MLLTRIWSAILALLATALLALVFLIPLGLGGDFTEAERTAIRGVTDGGLVAFEADIASSAVSLAPGLLADARLRGALELVAGEPPTKKPAPTDDGDGAAADDLSSQLIVVANEELLNRYPLMSVALTGAESGVTATTGIDERLFPELAALEAYRQGITLPDGSLFSAALGGKLYAVKISHAVLGHRLVAIEPLGLGGTSFLRRVLGSNPAGLVRDGALLGEPIGGASPEELVALVGDNLDSLPPEGASQALVVGTGGSTRIGAIGRVPGPAGKGENATVFAVISRDRLSSKQVDAMTAAQAALDSGRAAEVPWPIVGGVALLAIALALWLPGFEGIGPQRRLAGELRALAEGSQKQIFYDTYGGATGEVARGAAAAHEALRGQVIEELDAEAAEAADPDATPRRRPVTRSTRSVRAVGGRRGTRRHKTVDAGADDEARAAAPPDAIELPDAPEDAALESHNRAAPPPSSGAPPRSGAAPLGAGGPGPAAAAPTLSDEVTPDDSLVAELGGSLGASASPPAAPPRAAAPAPARPPAPAPAPASDDDPREAYFREIYDEFVNTKQACGENLDGFTYEKFARKLRKNTADLMKRPGTRDVQFSVYVKDGKAALKAKVIKD